MTTIFVSYAKEDAGCAEQINQELEAKGYRVWREPPTLSLQSLLYPRTVEHAILGSAAVILVWSSSAAQSAWVERHIIFAQRLKKPIVPILLDATSLLNTLIIDTTITSQAPCTDTVAHVLPHLPPPDSTDPLILLWEEAAHDSLISIRKRKATIEHAAEMLRGSEYREAALAILEYIAQHDIVSGMRNKASAVIEEDAKKVAQVPPPPFLRPGDSRHIFGARCKNGHISYFDKRRVCVAQEVGVREIEERAGTKLHKLVLKCQECDEELIVHVDCEGY
jgi:hypothetical protein